MTGVDCYYSRSRRELLLNMANYIDKLVVKVGHSEDQRGGHSGPATSRFCVPVAIVCSGREWRGFRQLPGFVSIEF